MRRNQNCVFAENPRDKPPGAVSVRSTPLVSMLLSPSIASLPIYCFTLVVHTTYWGATSISSEHLRHGPALSQAIDSPMYSRLQSRRAKSNLAQLKVRVKRVFRDNDEHGSACSNDAEQRYGDKHEMEQSCLVPRS